MTLNDLSSAEKRHFPLRLRRFQEPRGIFLLSQRLSVRQRCEWLYRKPRLNRSRKLKDCLSTVEAAAELVRCLEDLVRGLRG